MGNLSEKSTSRKQKLMKNLRICKPSWNIQFENENRYPEVQVIISFITEKVLHLGNHLQLLTPQRKQKHLKMLFQCQIILNHKELMRLLNCFLHDILQFKNDETYKFQNGKIIYQCLIIRKKRSSFL